MTGPRVVFVLGSPRSGTTWVQTLLGAHPAVVTPQETDVFARYVAPLQASWDHQMDLTPDEQRARRSKGLPAVMTTDEFHELVSSLVDRIVTAMAALEPTADVVVEKSPVHSGHTDLIARYLPDAAFIHVIRDGRDVATSLRAASAGWGKHWAPGELKRAATLWRDSVLGARRAQCTGRYVEIRYEDLRRGDPVPLRIAYEACGVTMDDDACRVLLEEYSLTRMAGGAVASPIVIGGAVGGDAGHNGEPAGFFGEGRVGGWTESWTVTDRLLFDAVAGDLLVALGYEPDRGWAGDDFARRRFDWSMRAQRTVALLGRRIGYRANLRLRRLPGPPPSTPYDPPPVDVDAS